MEQTAQSFRDLRKGVLNERSKDLLLAFLIAVIGLAGSYFVVGKSISDQINQNSKIEFSPAQEQSGIPAGPLSNQSTLQYHNEVFLVQGTMLVGDITRLTNLAFNPDKSYLIDYGNGTRHRMTSAVMTIRYNVAGIYLLQCFVQEDKQWKILSAQTITVRKPERYELLNQ